MAQEADLRFHPGGVAVAMWGLIRAERADPTMFGGVGRRALLPHAPGRERDSAPLAPLAEQGRRSVLAVLQDHPGCTRLGHPASLESRPFSPRGRAEPPQLPAGRCA